MDCPVERQLGSTGGYGSDPWAVPGCGSGSRNEDSRGDFEGDGRQAKPDILTRDRHSCGSCRSDRMLARHRQAALDVPRRLALPPYERARTTGIGGAPQRLCRSRITEEDILNDCLCLPHRTALRLPEDRLPDRPGAPFSAEHRSLHICKPWAAMTGLTASLRNWQRARSRPLHREQVAAAAPLPVRFPVDSQRAAAIHYC